MDMHLDLPYPPSVNSYWRHARGRHYISKEGVAYSREVSVIAIRAGIRTITKPVCVTIVASPPDRRRRDLDNILKATLDSLERAAVVEDDCQVKELHLRWGEVKRGGGLVVEIEVLEEKTTSKE